MRIRHLLPGAVVLTLAVLTSQARAQDLPRAAVPAFDGGGDVVLRRSVMRALEENGFVSVVSEDEVDRASGPPADVARATGADLVILGTATGSRRSRRLELVAYDASGRQIASETIRMRPGGSGRRALDAGISDLLAAALPQLAGSPAAPVATGGGAEEIVEEEEEPEDVADRSSGGGGGGGGGGTASDGSLGANPLIFVVRLGLVLRTRDAEAVLSSGMPRSWRSEPIYAELHAGLELRPLAQNDDMGRGLFLRGEFANAVGLGTRDPRGGEVSTHFWRVAADLGYLFPIGSVVELGASFGFGYDAYSLGANNEFPSVELPYLRPGVRGRLRLLDELIVVGIDSGVHIALDRGAVSAAFGRGDTIGFDVGGSVSGALDFGLAYSVDLSWVGYWHGFSGGGTLGDGVNGVEHGFRALLALGYGFR
jgi:hypothetical protein